MPGNATFEPTEIPLARDAAVITVARWNGLRAVYLPYVTCESIQIRSGAEPRAARFRYVLDDSGALPDAPTRFDKLIPDDATGAPVVKNDDELIVFRELGDDKREVLFYGFAKVPQADVSGSGQLVTFQGVGAEVRAWDSPLSSAIYRNGDDPEEGDDIEVERPVRFNPEDRPNCTPDGHDVTPGGAPGLSGEYPVFLDERLTGATPPQTYWTLGKAVRYLISRNDGEWITNPDTTGIDAQLQAIEPVDGETLDPSGPDTFEAKDIVIREYDATGKPWPVAVADLVEAYGFRFEFTLEPEWAPSGKPITSYKFSRIDGLFGDAPVALKLQEPGVSVLDPGKTNVGGLRVTRDNSAVANRIEIETKPSKYEISFILAPGYTPVAADKDAREPFRKGKLTDATKDKYRLYIADEIGEGHWDTRAGVWDTTAASFGDIENDENGDRRWHIRGRPALGSLLSKDSLGRRRSYELHVSTDYGGDVAKPWDGTGTWQRVASGYRLLPDRLGIYFEVDDPEDIRTGASGTQAKGGTIRGITASADPDGTNYKKFYLRLTCAIEGDDQIEAVADKRPATSSRFTITRRIDTQDHFAREGVVKPSPYYPAAGTDPVHWLRDDTEKALAYARAIQAASESAKFAGTVEIPRFTQAYKVGDRIKQIDGINMSMRVNSGGKDEGAQYPSVVGLDWRFGDRESTSLLLADRRAEPYRLF